MTTQEFSTEFDVLYDNISSGQAPGLTEYEKSIFLTKAQSEIIKNYFNPKGNKYQEGFDDSPKRQIDFSMLIRTTKCQVTTSDFPLHDASNSAFYNNPDDILVYINEFVEVTRNSKTIKLVTIPLSFTEYNRLMSKPFKRPLKNQAWRLMCNVSSTEEIVQLIPGPNDTITDYIVRYIKRPNPIILEDLTNENLSIEGEEIITECELDPILHQEILQRAVELAKAAYTGDVTSAVELGNRSE